MFSEPRKQLEADRWNRTLDYGNIRVFPWAKVDGNGAIQNSKFRSRKS